MAFREYFNSPTYADVTLCYGGLELPAHKLILTTSSDYFKAMLNSEYEEATKSRVTLHDDSSNALSGMICTFYGHTAYDMQTINNSDKGVLQVIYVVDLYVTASKYLVPSLCSQIIEDFPKMLNAVQGEAGCLTDAEDRFLMQLKEGEDLPWKDISARFQKELGKALLPTALQMRHHRLKEKHSVWKEQGASGLKLFEKVVWHVYSTHMEAAEALRSAIVDVIAANIDAWRGTREFAQLIADLPELAMDMISMLAGAKQQPAANKSKRTAGVADPGGIVVASRKSQRQR
ncbi:hypothetical protein LTR15_003273 [Elasticomyces elasticus]|nr:hypothetical protein LTR15_003273 [Elasticomyces elasticus]